jgi:hypothetical protein
LDAHIEVGRESCGRHDAAFGPELKQLINVIKVSDEDLGLKATWLSKITNDKGEHKSG